MKKALCVGITVAMIFGTCSVAMASEYYRSGDGKWYDQVSDGTEKDGGTDLSFTVDASYYVTIPATIAVDQNNKTELNITANGKIDYGKRIDVTVKSAVANVIGGSEKTYGGLIIDANTETKARIPFRAYATAGTALDSPVDLATDSDLSDSFDNGTLTYVQLLIGADAGSASEQTSLTPTLASFSGNELNNSCQKVFIGTYNNSNLVNAYWKSILQFVVALN